MMIQHYKFIFDRNINKLKVSIIQGGKKAFYGKSE